MKIQPEDYKFYKDDPNFNPQRNQAIIQETIQDNKKFFNDIGRGIGNEGMNRVDMVSSYGIYRFNHGDKKFKEFIGEARWKELIGEQMLEKARTARAMNKLNGNTKFMDYVLK